MSKMGQEIFKAQETVDALRGKMSESEIMSKIREEQGEMFSAVAEEYMRDAEIFTPEQMDEIYDVDGFEDTLDYLSTNYGF